MLGIGSLWAGSGVTMATDQPRPDTNFGYWLIVVFMMGWCSSIEGADVCLTDRDLGKSGLILCLLNGVCVCVCVFSYKVK